MKDESCKSSQTFKRVSPCCLPLLHRAISLSGLAVCRFPTDLQIQTLREKQSFGESLINFSCSVSRCQRKTFVVGVTLPDVAYALCTSAYNVYMLDVEVFYIGKASEWSKTQTMHKTNLTVRSGKQQRSEHGKTIEKQSLLRDTILLRYCAGQLVSFEPQSMLHLNWYHKPQYNNPARTIP